MTTMIRTGICHREKMYQNIFTIFGDNGNIVRTIRTGFDYLSPKAADRDAEKSVKHYQLTEIFHQFI